MRTRLQIHRAGEMIRLAAENWSEGCHEQTRSQGVTDENKADDRYALARDGRLYRQSAIGEPYPGPCIYAGYTCLGAPARPIGGRNWHPPTIYMNQRGPSQLLQLGDSQPGAADWAKDVVPEPDRRGPYNRSLAIAYGDLHAA